ncbi:hypothetical protein BC835DRAFT_1032776 [Cytidiella melzeri]|nr:hypothetical protein BC835DRAFT_1032776 [Cytidiella melzeri]
MSGSLSESLDTDHSRFFFDDEMVTIKVERTRFRVHRVKFLSSESDVVKTMLTQPGANDKTGAMKPVEIPNVTAAEMEALLTFFYDGFQGMPNDFELWKNLLSISTRLRFDNIRAQAIAKLDWSPSLTPVQRLYLAKKHDVPHWLRIAYHSICRRSEPLEVGEAEKIGWDTAIRLAKAREILRDPKQAGPPKPVQPAGCVATPPIFAFGGGSPKPNEPDDCRVSCAVDQVFGPLPSPRPAIAFKASLVD